MTSSSPTQTAVPPSLPGGYTYAPPSAFRFQWRVGTFPTRPDPFHHAHDTLVSLSCGGSDASTDRTVPPVIDGKFSLGGHQGHSVSGTIVSASAASGNDRHEPLSRDHLVCAQTVTCDDAMASASGSYLGLRLFTGWRAPAHGQASMRACPPANERTGQPTPACRTAAKELGRLRGAAVFWHLDTYPTIASARTAQGPQGAVVESLGRVSAVHRRGNRVAPTARRTSCGTARWRSTKPPATRPSIWNPSSIPARAQRCTGTRVPKRSHVLAGECLETPAGHTVHQGPGHALIGTWRSRHAADGDWHRATSRAGPYPPRFLTARHNHGSRGRMDTCRIVQTVRPRQSTPWPPFTL